MNLRLHWTGPQARAIDWSAAMAAGFAGGAVLMVVELAWVAMFGAEGPWRTTHLVAAIALGPETAYTSDFDVGVVTVALITHYLLGIAFGVLLALLVTLLHREDSPGSIEALGVAFGALLYFVNFHVITTWMPWFIEMRGWATFFAHLLFGLVTALLYWVLRRPGRSTS